VDTSHAVWIVASKGVAHEASWHLVINAPVISIADPPLAGHYQKVMFPFDRITDVLQALCGFEGSLSMKPSRPTALVSWAQADSETVGYEGICLDCLEAIVYVETGRPYAR
jgi:hypothetical protein